MTFKDIPDFTPFRRPCWFEGSFYVFEPKSFGNGTEINGYCIGWSNSEPDKIEQFELCFDKEDLIADDYEIFPKGKYADKYNEFVEDEQEKRRELERVYERLRKEGNQKRNG